MLTFRKNPNYPNFLLDGDGFYISYLPGDRPDNFIMNIAAMMASALGGNESIEKKVDETTLIKDRKFHILVGDWRTQYEAIAHLGFDACYEFFIANSAHRSDWSSDAAPTDIEINYR